MWVVYNVYIMKRKPISLKRLFILASGYLIEVADSEKNFPKANKEMQIIRKYLKYVTVHKDDEL